MEYIHSTPWLRIAMLVTVFWALVSGAIWGILQIVHGIKNHFLVHNQLRSDMLRLQAQVARHSGFILRVKLDRQDQVSVQMRESLMPPPLPQPTSDDWSDDARLTEAAPSSRT